ncbi:hypothetical protein ACQXZZ_11900, partial [Corynebacterium diphtheriae]
LGETPMNTSTAAGIPAAQPAFLSKERIIAKPGFQPEKYQTQDFAERFHGRVLVCRFQNLAAEYNAAGPAAVYASLHSVKQNR